MRYLQAGVEYWHLDRFRAETLLDCQHTVTDWWIDPPRTGAQRGGN